MEQLQVLIGLRREYGEMRRDIDARCGSRREERDNRERVLDMLNEESA